MTKLILILLIALVFEAVGVVFLSKGLKQIGPLEWKSPRAISQSVASVLSNRALLAGVFFEALFFGGLLILMSKGDVSFVWPLTSLGFVLTTLSAKIFLHEHVSPARWAGVLLIMLGAGLISWTEKSKETVRDPEPVGSLSAPEAGGGPGDGRP